MNGCTACLLYTVSAPEQQISNENELSIPLTIKLSVIPYILHIFQPVACVCISNLEMSTQTPDAIIGFKYFHSIFYCCPIKSTIAINKKIRVSPSQLACYFN